MSIGERMKDFLEVLDGLKEIKDFLDPKGQMSWSYFKKNLLPGLREAVLKLGPGAPQDAPHTAD